MVICAVFKISKLVCDCHEIRQKFPAFKPHQPLLDGFKRLYTFYLSLMFSRKFLLFRCGNSLHYRKKYRFVVCFYVCQWKMKFYIFNNIKKWSRKDIEPPLKAETRFCENMKMIIPNSLVIVNINSASVFTPPPRKDLSSMHKLN